MNVKVEAQLRAGEPAQAFQHVPPPCHRIGAELAAVTDQAEDSADIPQSESIGLCHGCASVPSEGESLV
jgi:hypothetical protein